MSDLSLGCEQLGAVGCLQLCPGAKKQLNPRPRPCPPLPLLKAEDSREESGHQNSGCFSILGPRLFPSPNSAESYSEPHGQCVGHHRGEVGSCLTGSLSNTTTQALRAWRCCQASAPTFDLASSVSTGTLCPVLSAATLPNFLPKPWDTGGRPREKQGEDSPAICRICRPIRNSGASPQAWLHVLPLLFTVCASGCLTVLWVCYITHLAVLWRGLNPGSQDRNVQTQDQGLTLPFIDCVALGGSHTVCDVWSDRVFSVNDAPLLTLSSWLNNLSWHVYHAGRPGDLVVSSPFPFVCTY